MTEHDVAMRVNGRDYHARVADRLTLADHLRQNCHLTGTHLGCEHGVCGTCTVLVDGADVRGCLTLAVQADGAEVTTVEGLGGPDADSDLSVVQEAFRRQHGLQCGFCTSGFVVTVTAFLRENPDPSDEEIRDALSGNLCRCTGYQGIVRAVRDAADATLPETAGPDPAEATDSPALTSSDTPPASRELSSRPGRRSPR